MIVAGLGCRAGASESAVKTAVAAALDSTGVELRDIAAFATEAGKSREAGLIDAAKSFGRPLIFVDPTDMARVAAQAVTHSARVLALKGVPSVAETAALAAVGRSARLLAPRASSGSATCALARGDGP